LVVESLLIRDGQTEAAVLAWEADARESAVPQHPLEFARPQPRRLFPAIRLGWIVRIDARHVLGEPVACPGSELLDRLVGLRRGLRRGRGRVGHIRHALASRWARSRAGCDIRACRTS